jgi:hypothetical protein
MAYEVQTTLNLPTKSGEYDGRPIHDGTPNVKQPGDTVTKKELQDAGQTDEQIAQLVKHGTLKEA